MKANGYAFQIRQLRSLERSHNRNYTEQALKTLELRLNTIDASSESDERKQRQRDDAMRQWEVFMQREIPANG